LIVDGDVTIGGDLTVSSSGTNQKLLTFDQERDWRFYQTGSGAGAGLGLESFYGTEAVGSGTGNKPFTIRTTGTVTITGDLDVQGEINGGGSLSCTIYEGSWTEDTSEATCPTGTVMTGGGCMVDGSCYYRGDWPSTNSAGNGVWRCEGCWGDEVKARVVCCTM
jgi:hypothetical protein